jgi:hypothetical protein
MSTRRIFFWDHEAQRVWVLSQRVHHGAAASLLCAIALAGMWHDRADRREWFRRARLLMS